MRLDPWTLVAIAGMSLATYACRGGGYWLFRQVKPTPLMRAILAYVPGTLFVSYVVPALVAGGVQTWVGAVTTALAMAATHNVIIAIFSGTAAAWITWGIR